MTFKPMLKEIYEALKNRLAAIPNVSVDYFLNQYGQEDEESILYASKAVFIEFLPIDWQDQPKNIQRAVLSFRIHSVSDCIHDDEQRITDLAIGHLELVQEVFKQLANYRIIDNTGNVLLESIVRKQTIPDHQLSVVIATIQEFQATIFDYSACKKLQKVNVTLEVTPEI